MLLYVVCTVGVHTHNPTMMMNVHITCEGAHGTYRYYMYTHSMYVWPHVYIYLKNTAMLKGPQFVIEESQHVPLPTKSLENCTKPILRLPVIQRSICGIAVFRGRLFRTDRQKI